MSDQPNVFDAAAEALASSHSLESLSRPFLDLLHQLTGLESTYLTEVRTADRTQVIVFADNRGDLQIQEGRVLDWQDTVCRRALESGVYATGNVPVELAGSPIGADLGMISYLGVPVVGSDSEVMGTLCAASTRPDQARPEHLGIMRLFARLIADQWERDRRHARALRRAATAEARLRERALFLAEVEHQLKSPLTIIRGWSELLVDDWDDLGEQQRRDASRVLLNASVKASLQLEDLLKEARSDALTHELVPTELDLNELLEDVARGLGGIVSERHTVRTVPVEPAESLVTTDRTALWQVLWHLAENAVKYSPGGGEICLAARVDPAEMIIDVTDQGIGVAAGVDVFAAFVRGPVDQVQGISGSGLGLHVVRNLMLALGGTVECVADPGPGARFRVTLPRRASASGPRA